MSNRKQNKAVYKVKSKVLSAICFIMLFCISVLFTAEHTVLLAKETKKQGQKSTLNKNKAKQSSKQKIPVKNKKTNSLLTGDNLHNVNLVKYAVARDWSKAKQVILKTRNKEYSQVLYDMMKIYYEPETLGLEKINSFFKKNNWVPRAPFLKRIESRIPAVAKKSDVLLSWFESNQPESHNGKLVLLDEKLKRKKKWDKKDIFQLRLLWRKAIFDKGAEDYLLEKYKHHLEVSDLLAKIDNLTWHGRYTDADRLISLLPKKLRRLPKSRILVARNNIKDIKRSKNYLNRYPEDPFLTYRYVYALQKNGKEKEAIKVLLRSKVKDQHEKWWKRKKLAIRDAIKLKNYKSAYEMTKNHCLPYGADMAEAEWLAGWISLRFLKKPEIAKVHFSALYEQTKFASSKSKASYWLARSYESMGVHKEAKYWYGISAGYLGTFYGNLSAAKKYGGQTISYFAKNEDAELWASTLEKKQAQMIAHTTAILHEARVYRLVDNIYQEIATMELQEKEIERLISLLKQWQRPEIVVKFNRILSNSGMPLNRHGYPKNIAIKNNKLSKPIYLAIIRQESSFDAKAISPAGARGLMQIMPATGRRVGQMFKLKNRNFARDSKANVEHGTRYFDHLYTKYNNKILAIAAYNSGPGNVNKWLKTYGDLRKYRSHEEIIDWIEKIPFSETRNYVKSVLENEVIYDSILSKSHAPNKALAFLFKNN